MQQKGKGAGIRCTGGGAEKGADGGQQIKDSCQGKHRQERKQAEDRKEGNRIESEKAERLRVESVTMHKYAYATWREKVLWGGGAFEGY